LRDVTAIAAGSYHNLALKRDGTVVAFGNNDFGQTNVPSGLQNVVAISGGYHHSLALKADGSLVTWGGTDNEFGVTNVPPNLTNLVAIAAGGLHSLALGRQSLSGSTVRPSNPVYANHTFSVSVQTKPGKSYSLEFKNLPTDPAWTMVPPVVAGDGSTKTLHDPTASGSQRFYRVQEF
jgi:hypothetical protein